MVLDPGECDELSALFDGGRFRSTIDMARYRFGDGRYRYFDHPLPDTVAALRTSFYRHLAPIANDWASSCCVATTRPFRPSMRNCWRCVLQPGRSGPRR